jgi:uncharacterized membrane protein YjgN (DUF898 family)
MEEKKEEKFEEVKFQEVEIKKEEKEVRTDSYFDGKVLELIGWKLLSYLITCVSAGIAYPWGKCMIYRYQFSHTVYNGKRLKFEGNGGDLFVNRFKWIFLTLITLGIYGWWVPSKKANWVISNLHFEDEEYKKEESFFEEQGPKLFWLNVLWRFLNIITVGLMIPFTFCMKMRYINSHAVINRKKLVFDGSGLNLLGKYIVWALLTCITFGIYGWWVQVKFLGWQASNIHIKRVGEENEPKEKKSNGKAILVVIPILIGGVLVLSLILWLLSSVFGGFSLEGLFKYPLAETIEGWRYCDKGYALSKMTGYEYGFCYKYDYTIRDDYECEAQNGTIISTGKGNACEFKKDPKKIGAVLEWENNHKKYKEIEEDILYPETSSSSSTCPSGWYYYDHYGKCAKDLEHVSYEECEAKGGMFAGYDSCTILE